MAKKKKDDEEDDPSVPKLLPEAGWLWRAFSILSVQRQYSQSGPRPISVAEVYALARIEELDGADTRWLLEVIVILDQLFLEETYEKLKKENERRARKTGAKGKRG